MKVTANDISTVLIKYCWGTGDILLPNFFYGSNEFDLFRISNSGLVIEYEIKVSRSDFFADFRNKSRKHERLLLGNDSHCPNRFFFVVPESLIKKSEVPDYAGLIYYDSDRGCCHIVKAGRMLHRKPFDNYKWIAKQLSNRAMFTKEKYERLKRSHKPVESNLFDENFKTAI